MSKHKENSISHIKLNFICDLVYEISDEFNIFFQYKQLSALWENLNYNI